ncbi:hypothetical protein A4G18_08780 [Pasteurellaceae bacterium Pebbles2]|nr:hypothetical protein [Pasteurellaceae bacterium Pebbles2]
MNKIVEALMVMVSGFVMIVTPVLILYAIYRDFEADKFLWAVFDLFTVIVGVFRGVGYLFGWL